MYITVYSTNILYFAVSIQYLLFFRMQAQTIAKIIQGALNIVFYPKAKTEYTEIL